MPKKSGFFGFVMINKNNSVECHASYHEGLLKFFAAFRMTTEHQIFAGDASLPEKKEIDRATSKGSTTKLTLDVFVKMSRYLGANFKGIVKDLVPFWQVSTQNMGY
ncbi:MAG: hypothetical protein V7K14_26000 [Nostoc sp.]|uniref:hypothetical protein n=1 Tax=Nostoc sp. TaxID=1180 RepID=UPI002FF744F1